jgi:hypothetical protein
MANSSARGSVSSLGRHVLSDSGVELSICPGSYAGRPGFRVREENVAASDARALARYMYVASGTC